ncbi:MAG: ATP-dependent DNA helicase RecG [Alphaproteobacteria bacterium]|nr:MAG: ATP-dependent DNA helicase RecG [Alphaproteobacteria bacterium]
MRPAILDKLFAPLTALPGIGAQLAKLFERLTGPLVLDLLWHLPTGIIDRRASPPIGELQPHQIATLAVRVEAHQPGHGRRPYRVLCTDNTGTLTLVYFNVRGDQLSRLLPIGAERVVSGLVEFYGGMPQIAHPDLVLRPDELDRFKPIEPVYPMTAGLSPRVVQKAIEAALERAPALPEWVDPALRERRGWPHWAEAVRQAQAPANEADLLPTTPARERLAYDEILASQLAVALVRARRHRQKGRAILGNGALTRRVEAALGFGLTSAQRLAIAEITAEMAQPRRMVRLLQGDVGSGKTVVGLLAMLTAVEGGGQAALMAPTEILARQHHATLQRHAAAAHVEIGFLTGREKGRARSSMLASLASGLTPVVVGTHALLQPDVEFRDLALVVIDEQHRFGVEQRLGLYAKGQDADTLLMSATPIPRTLMMTAYGDLDVSRLTEKPPGRHPVDTRTVALERLDDVVAAVGRALARGAKVYWICPMVEESETADLAAVEERHKTLAPHFPGRVALVHGRMKSADKDRAMAAFADGEAGLLVATTVIEVGVDVPDATVMVIEHAERFGLAQLHQLRGRIGRGDQPSSCLLLYQSPLGAVAKRRLEILRETEDGFRIAEEDLRLRGAGEVLGTRQSGLPGLRLADLAIHEELVTIAHDDARLVLERDPQLESERGRALRTLLYLFRRDEAVQYLRAG